MLTVFTTEQSEEWDKIVSSFGNYDIYYMSGYVKAFELHGDGQQGNAVDQRRPNGKRDNIRPDAEQQHSFRRLGECCR